MLAAANDAYKEDHMHAKVSAFASRNPRMAVHMQVTPKHKPLMVKR